MREASGDRQPTSWNEKEQDDTQAETQSVREFSSFLSVLHPDLGRTIRSILPSSTDNLYPIWTHGALVAARRRAVVGRASASPKNRRCSLSPRWAWGRLRRRKRGKRGQRGYLGWGMAGLLFLLAMFCLLEVHQPCFSRRTIIFSSGSRSSSRPVAICCTESSRRGLPISIWDCRWPAIRNRCIFILRRSSLTAGALPLRQRMLYQ